MNSNNFARNMCPTIKRIKEAVSTMCLAGAGVQYKEKTIAGREAKLSMLRQKLTDQQRTIEQHNCQSLVAKRNELEEDFALFIIHFL